MRLTTGRRARKLRQVDYGGALLTFASTTLLLLPLNWGGVSFAWSSPTVIGCLCGGVAGFVSSEVRSAWATANLRTCEQIVFFLYESKVAAIPIVPREWAAAYSVLRFGAELRH